MHIYGLIPECKVQGDRLTSFADINKNIGLGGGILRMYLFVGGPKVGPLFRLVPLYA